MPLLIKFGSSVPGPGAQGTGLGTRPRDDNGSEKGQVYLVPESSRGTPTACPPNEGSLSPIPEMGPDGDGDESLGTTPLGLKPSDDGFFEVVDTELGATVDGAGGGGLYFCYPRRSWVPQDLSWDARNKASLRTDLGRPPRAIVPRVSMQPEGAGETGVSSLNIYGNDGGGVRELGGHSRWPFRVHRDGSITGVEIGVPTVKWPLLSSEIPGSTFEFVIEYTKTPYNLLMARPGAGTFRRYFIPGVVRGDNAGYFGPAGDPHVSIDRQEGALIWIARTDQPFKGDEDIRWTVIWHQLTGGLQTRTVVAGPSNQKVLALRKPYNFVVQSEDLQKNDEFPAYAVESGSGVPSPEGLKTDLHVYCGLDHCVLFFPPLAEATRFALWTPLNAVWNFNPHLASGTDQPPPNVDPFVGSGVPFRNAYLNGVGSIRADPVVHTGAFELKMFKDNQEIGTCWFYCDPAQYESWTYIRTEWPLGPTT